MIRERKNGGRCWPQLQGDEISHGMTRDTMLAAIRVLSEHDALDLLPMLFAPLNPSSTR